MEKTVVTNLLFLLNSYISINYTTILLMQVVDITHPNQYGTDANSNIDIFSMEKTAQYPNIYHLSAPTTQPINNLQVGYNPNQMTNQNAFAACNQGIANGFGAMFFNMRDPTLKHSNVPMRQDSSIHVNAIVGTFIFIGGLITGILGLRLRFLPLGGSIPIIVITYLIYLIATFCCSVLIQYIRNMKRFEQYQATYQSMVDGQGFFNFHIECYHYTTGKKRRRVTTHVANEVYSVKACFDQSGDITSIHNQSTFVFINYLKRYYFTDDISQHKFVSAYNNFVDRNSRDVYQTHTHTFQINGYEQFVSFSAQGQNTKSMTTFFLFTFLGLTLPYSLIFERSVSRYEVGLLKRLTI